VLHTCTPVLLHSRPLDFTELGGTIRTLQALYCISKVLQAARLRMLLSNSVWVNSGNGLRSVFICRCSNPCSFSGFCPCCSREDAFCSST
jgi:hypothetical protein